RLNLSTCASTRFDVAVLTTATANRIADIRRLRNTSFRLIIVLRSGNAGFRRSNDAAQRLSRILTPISTATHGSLNAGHMRQEFQIEFPD
ncbi:MAG: hypothetical protein DWI29_03055, partial [Planctomycetota bacterium]